MLESRFSKKDDEKKFEKMKTKGVKNLL